ncbi:MAG TPA: DUF2505 domain-containing protein [Nevskiaceae bacterium]
MKHHASARYPAPADAVLHMFTQQEFHRRKLERIGLPEFHILECREQGDEFIIRVERKVAVKLPGLGRRPPALSTVVHTESWNRATGRGRIDVQMAALRLTMQCDAAITDAGADACVVDYDWTLRSAMPIVGHTIERLVAANMDKEAAPEHAAGIALLAEDRAPTLHPDQRSASAARATTRRRRRAQK